MGTKKKESLSLQIKQLFEPLFKVVQDLKYLNNRQLNTISKSLLQNLTMVQKYLQYWIAFVFQRESKISELQTTNQYLKSKLAESIKMNSKLKQDNIETFYQIAKKDEQIQKLRVLNKLNVSYASSIVIKQHPKKDQFSQNSFSDPSENQNFSIYRSQMEEKDEKRQHCLCQQDNQPLKYKQKSNKTISYQYDSQ